MPNKFTYEEVIDCVKEYGFILHSKEYTGIKQKLQVECIERGHITPKTLDSIRMGKGCNDCKKENRRLKYKDVKEYIENEEGWKLNGTKYIRMEDDLEMACPKGHNNYKTFHSFKIGGKRCSHNDCKYENMRDEGVKEYIEGEGYKVIDDTFHKKLKLECPLGHINTVDWSHFKRGNRCGTCNYAGTTELRIKEQLEKFLKINFTKIRPDWLINPITGWNMEIDMYNEILKIGVEYQGIQHYEYTPFFHRTPTAFQEQLDKDENKRNICRDNGIFLIEIPYYEKDVIKYICKELNNYFK